MAVRIYKGVVQGYGSGDVNGNNNSTFVTREYVDIGDVHLRKVMLPQYLDDVMGNVLQSGEEIQLSSYRLLGFRRTAVLAIKLANGQVRKEETFLTLLLHCLFFFVLAIVAGLVFSFVLAIVNIFGLSGAAIFVIGMLAGIAYGIHGLVNYLKARSAF